MGLWVRNDIGYSGRICRSRHLLSCLIALWTRSSKEKGNYSTVFRTSSRNSNAPSEVDPAQSIDSAIKDLNGAIRMLRADFFGRKGRSLANEVRSKPSGISKPFESFLLAGLLRSPQDQFVPAVPALRYVQTFVESFE